jgi:hypothetical protein
MFLTAIRRLVKLFFENFPSILGPLQFDDQQVKNISKDGKQSKKRLQFIFSGNLR